MVGNNPVDESKPHTGSPPLGRKERFYEGLGVLGRQTDAGVLDHDHDIFNLDSRCYLDRSIARGGRDGVVEQVDQDLPQEHRVNHGRDLLFGKLHPHRESIADTVIQGAQLAQHPPDGGRSGIDGGHPGILLKRIYELFEAGDLADDRFTAGDHDIAHSFIERVGPPLNAFGGEPDGGERVLYLMRDALCDLAPRRLPLGLHQLGEIVYRDHPTASRERARGDVDMDDIAAGFGSPEAVGQLMLEDFLIAFEAASLLLLIAAVAAIVLAGRKRDEKEPG